MDSRTSSRQIRSKIKELLRDLGLTSSVNTKIGYPGDSKVLSGGEKKDWRLLRRFVPFLCHLNRGLSKKLEQNRSLTQGCKHSRPAFK